MNLKSDRFAVFKAYGNGIQLNEKSKDFLAQLKSYFAGPSCRFGSFFCFLFSSEAPFAFLDSLFPFCSFDIKMPRFFKFCLNLGFIA